MSELNWNSPEVVALQQQGDREGIAQLVRDGRLSLSRHNPYRDRIPVDSSPGTPPSTRAIDDPAPDGRNDPLTRADIDRLRRDGRHDELRQAAKEGRIPWSRSNPYAPQPTPGRDGA